MYTGIYSIEFSKFDGQNRNTGEHIAHFINSMGPLSHNIELYLRESSKSLTDRAYAWYLNLKRGSIQGWKHLVTVFNTKFFYGEVKFTLAELGRKRQFSVEELDLYDK